MTLAEADEIYVAHVVGLYSGDRSTLATALLIIAEADAHGELADPDQDAESPASWEGAP